MTAKTRHGNNSSIGIGTGSEVGFKTVSNISCSPEDRASGRNCMCSKEGLTFEPHAHGAGPDYSGATAPDSHRLPRFVIISARRLWLGAGSVKKTPHRA
jgi:hypothetical protein